MGGFSRSEQKLQEEGHHPALPLPSAQTPLVRKSIHLSSNAIVPSVVRAKTQKSALRPFQTTVNLLHG